MSGWRTAGAPFSNAALLLIRQGVLPERQHHELGAVNQHHGAAILGIYADNWNMYVLDKTILKG